MNFLQDKNFISFTIKLIVVFLLAYYGTVAVIGLTAPGQYYSPFIQKYLNYPNWIRHSLLYGSKFLLSVTGTETYITDDFRLRVQGGRGVFLSYSCIGYGVMSFWIAFIFASAGTVKRKVLWGMGGLILIWLINILRISLLLVAVNKNWGGPFDMHHTLFNIVAYVAIFIVIYFFERSSAKKVKEKS